MRRHAQLVAAAAVASVVVVAAVLAGRRPEESLANGSGGLLVLEVLTASALLVAGAVVRPRRAGLMLLAAAAAFAAALLPLPDAGDGVLFTVALVLGGAAASLGGIAALELGAHVRPVPLIVGWATVAVCTVWIGLLPAVVFDPRATGCFRCPRNLVLVHGAEGTRTALLHSGLRAAAIASVVFAVALVASSSRRRWSQELACWSAAVALGASAAVFWAQRPIRAAWIVECVGLAALAGAPLTERVRARVERIRIVDAVLRTVPSADDLRAALASGAGDPGLALAFPHADGAVDGDGRPVPPVSNGTATTDVARGGELVAQLRHDALGGQAARRLADSIRAAGLALEYTSSRARLRAQLRDLTESRARIVQLADTERRRLERNLHDGAQQRLIALSVALAASPDPAAAEARDDVLTALEELRAVAHGIHPVSLSDGGIVASVRELAETSGVPLRLELRELERLPERLESAAYRVVADCVQAAERGGDGRPVSVGLRMTDSRLDAEVRLPGMTRAAAARELEHACDRVTAAGGRLSVSQGSNEAVVELSL